MANESFLALRARLRFQAERHINSQPKFHKRDPSVSSSTSSQDLWLSGVWTVTMLGASNHHIGPHPHPHPHTETKCKYVVSRRKKIKGIISLFSRQVYPQPIVLSVKPLEYVGIIFVAEAILSQTKRIVPGFSIFGFFCSFTTDHKSFHFLVHRSPRVALESLN
ncbi:hypothetical protein VNO78_10425 [Psophocarpus tetragonolobus]|uniref:Uncharacterized protein n=1 Tax=Psophocarpus tetragonolobus TaxID=3891 RepID=A0AAN9SMC0_PSOTE